MCQRASAVPRGFSCEAGWCRSKAIRCAQGRFRGLVPNRGFLGQPGAYRCFPVPWTPAIPHRAVTRSCARCSPLYWLLPAKTQLPPYGGLREFELKCLRSHPTPLRFHPQALSGTLRDSGAFLTILLLFPVLSKKSKTLFNLIELYISRAAQYLFSYCHHFA